MGSVSEQPRRDAGEQSGGHGGEKLSGTGRGWEDLIEQITEAELDVSRHGELLSCTPDFERVQDDG